MSYERDVEPDWQRLAEEREVALVEARVLLHEAREIISHLRSAAFSAPPPATLHVHAPEFRCPECGEQAPWANVCAHPVAAPPPEKEKQ